MIQLPEMISCGYIENKLMYPHCNPGMEMVLVEEGRLEWAVDNVPEMLNGGMVFFTLPWQVHGSLQIREPRNRIYYALFSLPQPYDTPSTSIRMPTAWGLSAQEETVISSVLVSARRHAWPASELLKNLFQELVVRMDEDSPIAETGARSLLRMMVVELVKIISQTPHAIPLDSPSSRRVRRFLRELICSLDQSWSLESMADSCGIRRTQFATLVKHLTGYPPSQYLNRLRFERACELLRSSPMPITDIAFECGYSSSQYFAESFRKNARMTPSEYRQLLPDLNAIMAANWGHPERRSIADEKKRAESMRSLRRDRPEV